MFEKEIINVDKTHRILVTRIQEDERIDPFVVVHIEPFIVFTPQRKGLLFWHNYHCIDFCQGFKYDYERTSDYIEYSDVLQELIDYLPELDKIVTEQGGVL